MGVHAIVEFHAIMKFALTLTILVVAVSAYPRTQRQSLPAKLPTTAQWTKLFESRSVPDAAAKATEVSNTITRIVQDSGRSDEQKRQDVGKVLAQVAAMAGLDKDQGTNKQSRSWHSCRFDRCITNGIISGFNDFGRFLKYNGGW